MDGTARTAGTTRTDRTARPVGTAQTVGTDGTARPVGTAQTAQTDGTARTAQTARTASLLAATVERIRGLIATQDVHIVTTASMTDAIAEDVPALDREQIIGEPMGRNTAPCVALAYHSIVARLQARGWSAQRIDAAVLTIMPADHHIAAPDRFIAALRAAVAHARRDPTFVTLGIPPDHPSTAYGYIERGADPVTRLDEAHNADDPDSGPSTYPGVRFVEKPDAARAATYLETGRFLWNAGLFVVRLGTLRAAFEQHAPAIWSALSACATAETADARARAAETAYTSIEAVAFDIAIMERLPSFRVVLADVGWTDLGSWRAVHALLPHDARGNARASGSREVALVDCDDSMVWSEDADVAVIGLEGVAVVCSGGRVLVCPLARAQEVRAAAKQMNKAPGRSE